MGLTNRCRVFDRVLSTTLGGWGWQAGTRMAALIYAMHGGNISPAQVEAIPQRSADQPAQGNGKDAFYGHGRVNAARVVAL